MANDNTATLIGNVTSDPELKFTPSGVATTRFGLAVNRRWKNNQTDEWEEATSFFNVVAWRELAEHLAESLTKGSRTVVVGRLEQRSWETDSGEKRSIVEVLADEVAPSLRWATAVVTKAKKADGSGGGARTQEPPAGFDEEPF